MANMMDISAEDLHLDSLPYVDGEVPDELSNQADALIEEEMKKYKRPKRDSSALPIQIPLFENNPLLSAALARLSKSTTPTPAIDTTRLRLDIPQDASVESFTQAVKNAQAQLEHQQARLVNLELVNAFGPNAWKLHCYQLEYLVKKMTEELEVVQKESTEVNKARKISQTRIGQELQALAYKYSQLLNQSLTVDAATEQLELEVQELRRRAGDDY
ncbi:Pre-mRNA-splicing factor SPF27 [Phlyctochytrium arcticum]|nr:Pre-mRNA-splicing factor SPF27 [Phlyctochytrium arcticum]